MTNFNKFNIIWFLYNFALAG